MDYLFRIVESIACTIQGKILCDNFSDDGRGDNAMILTVALTRFSLSVRATGNSAHNLAVADEAGLIP